jgi:cytidine deaminase
VKAATGRRKAAGGARQRPASGRPAAKSSRPDFTALMRDAERARANAYAPYSRFPVGAALLTSSGRVIRGSNVENASYGLGVCAERVAMLQAVSEGEREFVAIAVTGPSGRGAPPCGACRQVLHEFAPRLQVVFRDARGRVVKRRLDQLLPYAFDFRGGGSS